jgi:hypothetical protein
MDYPVAAALDADAKTGWAINVAAGEGSLNTNRTAVFLLKSPLDLPSGSSVQVTLRHEHSNRRYQLGRFRLSVTGASAGQATFLPRAGTRELVEIPDARRTASQREQLLVELKRSDPERVRLAARVTELEAKSKELTREIPSTLVMREMPEGRQTHVHIRGDFLRKGTPVQPNVPECLPPLPALDHKPNRLDLARWLVDDRNPLTPRVTVNRFWDALFGRGLVETENDFGRQGAAPSHPELLDWLASEFRSSAGKDPHACGWSTKKLLRTIVTSATYRQASTNRPELNAVDPENRLLARQSRLRLEAEIIRDTCLAASGLLSRKVGGPSVYPPAPASLDLFTQNKKNWQPSQGEDRYRRGMYTFFWRSSPYAMFATFDAPNAQVTCTRRNRSNTPLGALMLANDQSVFEMAQGLAVRVLGQPGNDEARLRAAFRSCLSREPSSAETRRLNQYLHQQLQGFEANPSEAEKVAARERPAGTTAPQAAAWTAVARVLLNLDEFITRE